MVLGIISSDGDVLVHFFKPKEKVTAEVYCEVLSSKVIPWMNEVANGRMYTFQQDSAPAHTAKRTLELLTSSVPHFWGPDMWPPNSPDLNPCDFYLWGRLEKEACKIYHKNIASLKASITREAKKLDRHEVETAVRSFRRRVEVVIENGGNHYTN